MTDQLTQSKANIIAKVNDKFRFNIALLGQLPYGKLVLTEGARDVPDVYAMLDRVAKFKNFTKENDPHGEHDFGELMFEGTKLFWKIDYYDSDYRYGEDALSHNCKRVLTVMLASEY